MVCVAIVAKHTGFSAYVYESSKVICQFYKMHLQHDVRQGRLFELPLPKLTGVQLSVAASKACSACAQAGAGVKEDHANLPQDCGLVLSVKLARSLAMSTSLTS